METEKKGETLSMRGYEEDRMNLEVQQIMKKKNQSSRVVTYQKCPSSR